MITADKDGLELVANAIHAEYDRWRCLTGGTDMDDVIVRDDDDGEPQEVSRHPQGDGGMHFWDLLFSATAEAAIAAMPRPTPAQEQGWRPIETCDTWRFDHMTPMIAYWPTRGPRETYFDVDEDFHRRPKGWPSPSEGWRSPGDQCIPVASCQPTHWREFPAAPTERAQ